MCLRELTKYKASRACSSSPHISLSLSFSRPFIVTCTHII
jgi:hypothetical protein